MIDKIYARYNGTPDEQWLEILFDSIQNNKIDGILKLQQNIRIKINKIRQKLSKSSNFFSLL